MAGEQEVNQRSIISQPAPGGKGASHATPPSLSVGTPASLGTPRTAVPCSVPMGFCQCLCARSHLRPSLDEPVTAFL